MKWGLRRVGGFLVVLAFCFAGARAFGADSGASTAADNQAAAQQDAGTLLTAFVVPPGASEVASEPEGDGGALAGPPTVPLTPNLVDRSEWFTAPSTASDVLAYERSHAPSGSSLGASGGPVVGPNGPSGAAFVGFSWPPIAGVLATRSLIVSAIDLSGGMVGVRVDAQDVWITPRPAWEQIPVGVASVSIVARSMGGRRATPLRVRSPGRVQRLISVVDGLPLEQPGVRSCPAGVGPTFVVRFLAAGSSQPLAEASTASGCNGVRFELGGTTEPALDGADQLVDAINQLGVIPKCVASQLRTGQPKSQPGERAYFTLTSTSLKLCLLRGYPRLTIRDAHGAQLPVTASKSRRASSRAVDMPPGGQAALVANWKAPERACIDPAASVNLALPGRHAGSLAISLPRYSIVHLPCRGRITLLPFTTWP